MTPQVRWSRWPAALTLACLAQGVWGCGPRTDGFERYVPAPSTARAAVAAMLDGWKAGRPADADLGTTPEAHVVDKQRKPGQRLARYEILGEVAAEKSRGFAVRLTLEEPDEQQVARFVVAGINPLWVFRQEDFEMISHWMHPMAASEPAADPGARP